MHCRVVLRSTRPDDLDHTRLTRLTRRIGQRSFERGPLLIARPPGFAQRPAQGSGEARLHDRLAVAEQVVQIVAECEGQRLVVARRRIHRQSQQLRAVEHPDGDGCARIGPDPHRRRRTVGPVHAEPPDIAGMQLHDRGLPAAQPIEQVGEVDDVRGRSPDGHPPIQQHGPRRRPYDRPMSARAGIVVTGTEVLTGRVRDTNGPWLAEQLRAFGVDISQIVLVGDRPEDLLHALAQSVATNDLVITTGGLGPTADDLTTALVARFRGRELALDPALHQRVADIVDRLVQARGWATPQDQIDAGTRKQALVPVGAHVLEPTGTAPGLVVPGAEPSDAPIVVLPGPPRELREMWPAALADDLVVTALGARSDLRQETIRIWGPPEAELAAALRDHEHAHGSLEDAGLEVSTCLRGAELEVVTRHSPASEAAYARFVASLRERFGTQIFAECADTIDDVLAAALIARDATVATAESCTGGLVAGRLTDRAGSSDYMLGGLVTYANAVKQTLLGVPADLLARVGAVSEEVAVAMAHGARTRLGATYGLSTTGVAGPGGATPTKPVGLVHICVAWDGGERHQRLLLSGSRAHVRERTVGHVLHLLREQLA